MSFEVHGTDKDLIYNELEFIVADLKGRDPKHIDLITFGSMCDTSELIWTLGSKLNNENLLELGIEFGEYIINLFEKHLSNNVFMYDYYLEFIGKFGNKSKFQKSIESFRKMILGTRIDYQLNTILHADPPEYMTRPDHATKSSIAQMLKRNLHNIINFELFDDLLDLFEYSVSEMDTQQLMTLSFYLHDTGKEDVINRLRLVIEADRFEFLDVFNRARVKIFNAIYGGLDNDEYITPEIRIEIINNIANIRASKTLNSLDPYNITSVYNAIEVFSDDEIDFVFNFLDQKFGYYYASTYFNQIRNYINLEEILEPIRGRHHVFRKGSSELVQFAKSPSGNIESPYGNVVRRFNEKISILNNPTTQSENVPTEQGKMEISLDKIYLHLTRMSNMKYMDYTSVVEEDEDLFYLANNQTMRSSVFPKDLYKFISLQRDNIQYLFENDYTMFEVYINKLKDFYKLNSPKAKLILLKLIFAG